MSPRDDRDIRAALSRAQRTGAELEAAAPMTTPTPLPCPFCGTPEPTMMHDGLSLPRGYYASWVWCEACNATGPEENTTEADAVTAWNRAPRPETAATEARRRSHAVSALREENARLREQLTVAREAAQVAAVEARRLRRRLRERTR